MGYFDIPNFLYFLFKLAQLHPKPTKILNHCSTEVLTNYVIFGLENF